MACSTGTSMLNNYYVLRSLAHEWQQSLKGLVVKHAWTQSPGELCLALDDGSQVQTLTYLTHRPLIGAFAKPGYSRARRNQRDIFRPLCGQQIKRVQLVEGERILKFATTGHLEVQAYLFGSRANVYLIDEDGQPIDRFRTRLNAAPPPLRPAVMPTSLKAFQARWAAHESASPVRVLAAVMPYFDRTLAEEALLRSGLNLADARSVSDDDLARLYEAAEQLHQTLMDPNPCVYKNPLALAVCPLATRTDQPADQFTQMGTAAQAYAQQALAQRAFREAFAPREKALVTRLGKAHRTVEQLKRQQVKESKESQHRRFGDLLMAAGRQPPGPSSIELLDLFQGGEPVRIPLNPALNSLENAEHYYAKARNARRHREQLTVRLTNEQDRVQALQQHLQKLQSVHTMKELKALEREISQTSDSVHEASGPFRRYVLNSAYELWVGRNAKESEQLTLRHARPFDLWLHARGVSGAHAVLRLHSRKDNPSSQVIEQAAAIAAWHSKARGSSMVPVIVTPRKYVRKGRGGGVGAMVVMREQDVVIVEPALP